MLDGGMPPFVKLRHASPVKTQKAITNRKRRVVLAAGSRRFFETDASQPEGGEALDWQRDAGVCLDEILEFTWADKEPQRHLFGRARQCGGCC